ncbi:hypothetical protein [Pedobacter sp. NJ-S-72]
MQAVHISFNLELKHPFSIAGFTRTSTPLLLLKLTYENIEGYGEASMVPYLGESYDSAEAFLKKVNWTRFKHPFDFGEVINYLNTIDVGNPAIKAAIDIALNDINGKRFYKNHVLRSIKQILRRCLLHLIP